MRSGTSGAAERLSTRTKTVASATLRTSSPIVWSSPQPTRGASETA